jgi:hypothetical protein
VGCRAGSASLQSALVTAFVTALVGRIVRIELEQRRRSDVERIE